MGRARTLRGADLRRESFVVREYIRSTVRFCMCERLYDAVSVRVLCLGQESRGARRDAHDAPRACHATPRPARASAGRSA